MVDTPEHKKIQRSVFNPFDKLIKKVYGPYLCNFKPKRRMMHFVFVDGSKTGMAYARWLMIQHLQRKLKPDEYVDHIDEDTLNDVVENFQLLSSSANARKSATGKPSPQKGIEKGWRHGTMYGWMDKKCRCTECLSAKRKWYDERNKRRNAAYVPVSVKGKGTYHQRHEPADHGTYARYKRGCRCDDCRRANASHAKALRCGERLDTHKKS